MGTVTETLARWAAELEWDDLTPEAIDAAKLFLYDSLGCALGGYQTADVKIYLEHTLDLGGNEACTLIGSGRRTSPSIAALGNALMIRALDYNDIYWKQDPSHPSDLIPAATGFAERDHRAGKDLITAIVLAYEIEMRLCEFAVPGIRERGWHHATLTAIAAPIVAGWMLGLSWRQMQHSIGISACHQATFGAAVAGKLTMMKNTVDPLATQGGVEAAMLARRGYTGPEGVLDGKEGLMHCLGPEWDLGKLTDGLGDRFKIADCGMKSYPVEALMHSPLSATLHLVHEHGLRAEDVQEVLVESIARAADILSDPAKYDPQSRESADHSLPYSIAAALAEGRVTPVEFTEEKLWDERLRAQMKKVRVVANEEFERAFPARQCARVTITLADGRKVTRQVDVPKGDPRDPMTPDEVQTKFDALADPVMSASRRLALKDAVFGLEREEDCARLLQLCAADR
ncbi:MAG: MmgE/PrpD family protein [Phycisphaerae bacterium]|jgi:2-methylcitrate dehydratase